MFDVCIIGSGPAGMAAAIKAAQKGAKIKLLDKNKKAGKKLYATGNGKCNITNQNIDYTSHYHSEYESYETFLNDIMGEAPCDCVKAFMDSIGVLTYTNNEGYVYPLSNQASSVVWALLDAINKYNIDCDFKAEVLSVNRNNDEFIIKTQNEAITASQIVFACGGKSYFALGGTDSGYKLAKSFGHTIVPVRPSLCGMHTQNNLSDIAGVRARANANLVIDDTIVATESGEIQFTENGLSGIAIFNLSSIAGKAIQKQQKVSIQLNLNSNIDQTQIDSLYIKNQNRTILGALNGVYNDKLCSYILSQMGINGKDTMKELSKNHFLQIIDTFSCLKFDIEDLYDYDQAQVCAGGVAINEINSKTCESKLINNVYFVGEMLDIDGICGGYNITFALLSGICAGEHIYVTN